MHPNFVTVFAYNQKPGQLLLDVVYIWLPVWGSGITKVWNWEWQHLRIYSQRVGSAAEGCNTCLTLQRRAAAEAVEFSPHAHFVALNILCGNSGWHQVSVGDAGVSMWMHHVYLWLWPRRGGLTAWGVIVCDRLSEVRQKSRLLLILLALNLTARIINVFVSLCQNNRTLASVMCKRTHESLGRARPFPWLPVLRSPIFHPRACRAACKTWMHILSFFSSSLLF